MNINKLKKDNIENKNFTKWVKLLITSGAAAIALGGFATIAFAQSPLSVTFTPNPLFVQKNFLPADEATGKVEVKNLGTGSQTVITEAVHVFDPDNLSSQLHLLITKASGGDALYNGSFKTFLTGGEKVLSVLSEGGNETYTFIVTFNDVNDNSYQGKTLDFNLCVGFQGGQTRCGDTVIDGEGNTDNGSGGTSTTISGSGGGGGDSGTRHLVIFNEEANDVTTTATITWETNLLSTSQVIYGLADNGPYTLNLTPPNFGYPSYTPEDSAKVVNHSVTLTGLTPGETYVYRVISRASPPTISYEHQFTVPTSFQTEGGGTSGPLGISWGEILGASSGPGGDGTSTASTSDESNLAAVFAAGWGGLSWWWLWILLIILAAYLFWRFVLKPGNKDWE